MALTLLDRFLKETDRASGIEADERRFLIGLSGTKGTDAELIRLDRLVRGLLLSQLRGDPSARLRVLRLFDPDIRDAAAADPEIVRRIRRALRVPLVSDLAASIGKEAAVKPGQPGELVLEDKRITAVRRYLRNGQRGVSWQVLYDGVRDECDGWDDPQSRHKKPKPGYGDRTIHRLATQLMSKARSRKGV